MFMSATLGLVVSASYTKFEANFTYSLVVEGDLVGSFGPIAFTAMSVWVLGWTMAAVKSQAFFFTVGALIGIFVSTLSPGKPNSEDSKLSRPFMGRQASWLSELSTSTTAGKRD